MNTSSTINEHSPYGAGQPLATHSSNSQNPTPPMVNGQAIYQQPPPNQVYYQYQT